MIIGEDHKVGYSILKLYTFAADSFYLSDCTRPTDPVLPIPVVQYYTLML
jgi:hypothetical protein